MPLRLMTKHDLSTVNKVLSTAFSRARMEEGYKSYRVPPCRLLFLEMYWSRFPEACFVVEVRNRVIGFVFTHLWGEVGWMGPLAVLPDYQGRGYGKALVENAVQCLIDRGVRTLGLETMPRNYRNIDFYTRMHFHPQYLTVDLIRPVGEPANFPEQHNYRAHFFSSIRVGEQSGYLDTLETLAGRVDPHLRIRKEVELVHRFKFGDALLVLKHETPIGFAVGHTEKYYEEERRNFLKIYLGGLHPDFQEQDVLAFLAFLERWARSARLDHVMIRIPTRQQKAFSLLLHMGFHSVHSDVRFILQGYPEVANISGFYLNKWE